MKHPASELRRGGWRPWELQLLREEYAHVPTVALAEVLRRPLNCVFAKADDLGLKKSPEYFSTWAAGRLQGERGRATRFQPGLVPWNKGKNFVSGGRSAQTRFRPGQMPHNWRPVGTYRVNSDGYLYLKVADHGPSRTRWEPVHRIVWREAHGEIPPGHIVVFKPRRRSTDLDAITVDAVECITRRELVARNTIHRYPESLKQAIRLAAKLRRRIDDEQHPQY